MPLNSRFTPTKLNQNVTTPMTAMMATGRPRHPAVARVNWPGLPTHPGHAVAAAQMRDFGAMLSIELHGGRDAALAVAGKLRVFTNATSLGGCESLVEHRASVEGPNPRSPQNLLRISVGLEDGDDLAAVLKAGANGEVGAYQIFAPETFVSK